MPCSYIEQTIPFAASQVFGSRPTSQSNARLRRQSSYLLIIYAPLRRRCRVQRTPSWQPWASASGAQASDRHASCFNYLAQAKPNDVRLDDSDPTRMGDRPRMTTDPLFGNTIAKMQQFDGRASQRNADFSVLNHSVNNHELKSPPIRQCVTTED